MIVERYMFKLILIAFYIPAIHTINNQIPEECVWEGISRNNLTLICHLKTINSEFEKTNLSVLENHKIFRLHLICSNNSFFQSNLNSESFKEFSELESLTIEFCKFKSLSKRSFLGLKNLHKLSVRTYNSDWSPMSLEIAPNTFTDFEDIKRLDLSTNNILQLPRGIFSPMKMLQYLNLSSNEIKNVELFNAPNGSTPNSKWELSLLNLDLSFNKISSVSSQAFSNLASLETLNLSHNLLRSLDKHTFGGLIKIKLIDLSYNRLTTLPSTIFSNNRIVNQLNFKNNLISVLPSDLFKNLEVMQILDLSLNELYSQSMNNETFADLRQLILLNLSGNKVFKLQFGVFNNLKNLKTMKLDSNLIEDIPNNLFEKLKLLHILTLSKNRLKIIGRDNFKGLVCLRVLSLDYNQIGHIQFKSFIELIQLEDLHLNSNNLHEVPDALIHLTTLKTLDIGENLITSIENTSLTKMSDLFGLRLTGNGIGQITSNTFYNLASLRILNLSQNKIAHIQRGSFQKNTQLQAIRLDGNNMESMSDVFNILPKLLWLNLSKNELDIFEYSHIPPSLQWLDISDNKITDLNFHESNTDMNIATLDASFNNIIEITPTSLISSIENVYLNNNKIRVIRPYSFLKKPKLKNADLRSNLLTTLQPNAFRITPDDLNGAIPKFLISKNPFECDCKLNWLSKVNIVSQSLPEIKDLAHIYCNISYERSSPEKLLIKMKDNLLCKYESHCFTLCHCCDFEACDCKMECPRNCTCYHDESWTANIVDCSRSGYDHNLPKHIPMDSTQLYLDGNKIFKLKSHTFLGRKRLKVLLLNHSYVEELQNRSFYGLLDLEKLRLNHNNIRSLNGNEFCGLYSLKELFLNHNAIGSIFESTFSNLYNLKILHLDHNQLIKWYVWNYLPPFLNTVTLSNNPWSCDCNFLEKFFYYMMTHSTIHDKQKLMCTIFEGHEVSRGSITSQYFGNKSFYFSDDIIVDGKKCNIKEWVNVSNFNDSRNQIHSILSPQHISILNGTNPNVTKLILYPSESSSSNMHSYILIICLVFIILSIVTLIYKDEIRVKAFTSFGIKFFKDEEEFNHHMLFDVFLSYCSKDDAFIHECLVPELEQKYSSYKICLHHRDICDSPYITDNILQAINSSRRTIIVLSENFIKFEWKWLEYKAAFHSILQDRRKRMIVICLENIPKYDLDEELKLYLKANKCLKWGEKMFWEKLGYVLPNATLGQKEGLSIECTSFNERSVHLSLSGVHPHQNCSLNRDIEFLDQSHEDSIR